MTQKQTSTQHMNKMNVSFPQQLEIAHQADVMVVGGGPGGIGAAVAAARGGADVLLVEHYGFLGGMATAGEVNPFMPNHLDGRSLDTGIFEEWIDRIGSYGGLRGPSSRVFDPNIARLAAEDLCVDAGVRLLYHHRAAYVERNGRRIDGLVLHSKTGLQAAVAKVYIDSTGDGDVAALAGCRFEFGDEASGNAQPMTLCFKLKLDRRDFPADLRGSLFAEVERHREEITSLYQTAKSAGRVDCPREDVLIFPGIDPDVVHFNTTRVIQKNATSGQQLSDAEIIARRQFRQLWQLLRSEMPLFRHSRIHSIAPQIGIRESRRIVGRYYLTVADYDAARRFPDAIARVTYPIDIHNPGGSGTVMRYLPKGQWYEVPWRSLLPQDVDNLAIASRCISVDHATHSSLRVMPPVCSFGQAAGTAAAMAVEAGMDIAKINGIELNARLAAQGRSLPRLDPSSPQIRPDAADQRNLQIAELTAKRFSA